MAQQGEYSGHPDEVAREIQEAINLFERTDDRRTGLRAVTLLREASSR